MIRKKAAEDSTFTVVDTVPPGTDRYTVSDLICNHPYLFQVVAVSKNLTESSPVSTSASVAPTMHWFDGTRVWFLVVLLIFCGSVIVFVELARRGVPLKVRKIAGLEAIDEAVGRATEMGRSCLFVPGIGDMNDMGTIAGMSILARVAKTAAEYNASIEVPTCRSLVMTAGQETVQAAFFAAGRPDAYNPNSIYYVSDEQFAYVAHIQGLMLREKPAACFYMGSFFAESLILAEMGNSIGAIQIAGTGQPAQLPFFVAACDYTLIGEEFFAASAYLSGEPGQIGSLKGQDVGKLIVAGLVIAGVIAETLVVLTNSPAMRAFVDYLTQKGSRLRSDWMKRTIPLLITAIGGFVLIASYFIPPAQKWGESVSIWFDILSSIAFVLGGANLLMSHLKSISDRGRGWGYSVVVLVSFLGTLFIGLGKIGVHPSPDFPKMAWSGYYREMGSGFWFIYQYGYTPLAATIFAMLAFYVASAAFRAFRAKNLEAALLLGTAFIVLLGRTFAGVALTIWIDPSKWSGV